MKIHRLLENPKNFLQREMPFLYKGEVFLFPLGWDFTKDLLLELEAFLIQEFGANFFYAEFFLTQEEHFEKLSRIRKYLYNSSKWIDLAKNFLQNLGLKPKEWIFDIPRIRGIVTEKNRSPLAEPAYYIHRDTWYGNSESQINLWTPLCDTSKQNGFAFYFEYFQKEILNNSNEFSFQEWKQAGSYQSENTNKFFPKPLIAIPESKRASFECPKGGLLIFSSSHLHETLPNLSSHTRFSLDLRIVNLNHYFWNLGSPNVDNLSHGNNIEDMILL